MPIGRGGSLVGAMRGSPQAAAVTSLPATHRQGKMNPYQTQTESLIPTLDVLPLNVVILCDGYDITWRDALVEY
jgi:hypothetical protein